MNCIDSTSIVIYPRKIHGLSPLGTLGPPPPPDPCQNEVSYCTCLEIAPLGHDNNRKINKITLYYQLEHKKRVSRRASPEEARRAQMGLNIYWIDFDLAQRSSGC